VLDVRVLDETGAEHAGRDAEFDPGHQRATNKSGEIGDEAKDRKHEHKRHYPRQHQNLDGVEAERAHRVDFLVELHGSDGGGEGRCGAAGDDDGGQEDPEFAQ
jgi:hypothetical protein